MNSPLPIIVCAAAVVFFLAAPGCGSDSDCRTDHDCDDEAVCEPDGCQQACSDDTDCPASYECAPRRVEEGRVCAPRGS